ncbi:hypothetical protein [Mesorhizobium sp. M0895]|uniref:hypothetical protein n=1 Tax=Mesorhizobium sp. M0895 TaxID=2957019 RepID=UPI00333CC01F
MIRAAPATASGPINKADAKKLTDRIRKAVDDVWTLLLEAYERKAWNALGHPTWEAYVKAEFDMSRRNSYRLLDQGRVVREIEEIVPHAAQITQREIEAIKDDLPALATKIKARVADGEDPAKAATDVIADKRAEKERVAEQRKFQQAEFDRQRQAAQDALPPAVKSQVAAVREAIAKKKTTPVAGGLSPVGGLSPEDKVAELEEAVRVLEGEAETLRTENAKFADMWVQYQQGGFEVVIAGKDEEIRVLKTRVYRESEDKAGWAKVAKFWRKQAVKLGYSNDALIPVEPTSDQVITLDV